MPPSQQAGSSSRRGRKIPADQEKRMKTALETLIAQKAAGRPISVRDVAEFYQVSKSTLHRRYTAAIEKKNKKSTNKHSINFLLSKDK